MRCSRMPKPLSAPSRQPCRHARCGSMLAFSHRLTLACKVAHAGVCGSLVLDLQRSVLLIVVGVGARDLLCVYAGTAEWRVNRKTYQPRDLRGRLYGWIWRRATGKDRGICAWCQLFFRQSFANGRSAAHPQPARTAQIDAQHLTHRGWKPSGSTKRNPELHSARWRG